MGSLGNLSGPFPAFGSYPLWAVWYIDPGLFCKLYCEEQEEDFDALLAKIAATRGKGPDLADALEDAGTNTKKNRKAKAQQLRDAKTAEVKETEECQAQFRREITEMKKFQSPGGEMKVNTPGQDIHFDKRCALEALRHNETNSIAWYSLGAAGGSDSHNVAMCFVEALRHNPRYVDAWYNLGVTLGQEQRATIGDIVYNQRDCYITALKIDAKCSLAWYNLGAALVSGEFVEISGSSYNRRGCFLQATQERTNADAWFRLGNELATSNEGDTAILPQGGSTAVDARHCYTEALKHNSDHALAWAAIGHVLSKASPLSPKTISVHGAVYSTVQCLTEALRCDGKMDYVWRRLGDALELGETVTVTGVEYDQNDCYSQAERYHSVFQSV